MSEEKQIAETPFHLDPMDYKIVTNGDGSKTAANLTNTVNLLNEGEIRMVNRRAIKMDMAKGETTFDTVLIAELDGVKVYIRKNDIVITKQELRL